MGKFKLNLRSLVAALILFLTFNVTTASAQTTKAELRYNKNYVPYEFEDDSIFGIDFDFKNETVESILIKAVSQKCLGIPYVWGGTTLNGFDCSGFVQYVYKTALDIDIPRVTWDQRDICIPIDEEDAICGDLIFPKDGHHVMLYLGDGVYISAPYAGAVIRLGYTDTLSDDYSFYRVYR